MDVALLDSAIVAGFLDADDAFHTVADRRVRELAGRQRLVVSVITYAELLTGAGLGHHDEQTVRGFFDDLVDEILPVVAGVAERAAELRSARAIKLPDALILATAELAGAHVISGDERWNTIPGLRCPVELLKPVGR
jgi:hypothetical protein